MLGKTENGKVKYSAMQTAWLQGFGGKNDKNSEE